MSFSWANLSLAKQALKNAQRKIDAVLDIREEDEEGESLPVIDEDDSFITSLSNEASVVVSEQPSGVGEGRSDAATSECDHWTREWKGEKDKNQVIVDAEPNPIHDIVPHTSSSLLNHSPNSTSPDEAENEDHARTSEHDSGDEPVILPSTSAIPQSKEETEFSTIPLNSPPHDAIRPNLSRRSSRHEDQMTVASSDIEVIRNSDAWSLTSSVNKIPFGDTVGLPPSMMTESLDALRGQLRHHEQRIDELTASNQRLTETNSQLQQRIVALNQQEKVLRKELEQKEEERKDILEEGKRMSDYSAKQSREIRRLKAQVADVEKIKSERKKYKDEKTEHESTIEVLNEEMRELNDKLSTLEKTIQEEMNEKSVTVIASEHHKTQQEENMKKIVDLEAENAQLKGLLDEFKEMKLDQEEKLSTLCENELTGRIASERANESAAIAFREASELREQVDRLKSQLSNTQTKLRQAVDEKSQVANIVAQANEPLLAEIEDLKAALNEERSTSEETDQEKRNLLRRIDCSSREIDRLNEIVSTSNERHATEQRHLLDRLSKIENQQASLVSVHKTQLEVERDERRGLETQLTTERKTVDDLNEECEAIRRVAATLEKTQSELREQLADAKEKLEENEERLFGETSELTRPSPVMQHHSSAYNPHHVQVERGGQTGQPVPSNDGLLFTSSIGFATPIASSAAETELSSLMRNHDQSMRRICEMESTTRRCEEAVESRDEALKGLRNKYKELEFQYNSLLEVDGERLERIDELQNDVIDLRQLLKDQLLAFADAHGRDSAPPIAKSSDD